jgi:DNA polymerase-1
MLIEHLNRQDEFCFDTETDNLDPVEANLVGLAFCYYKGEAYYVPIPADQPEAQAIVNEFKGVMENPAIGKIGQNMKFDIIVLKNYGVAVRGKIFDTMLAHYLIEPDMRHNINILAETYLNYSMVHIESLIGKKGKNQGNMSEVEIEKIAEYAGEDADITFQLKEVFVPLLKENKMDKLFHEVENPLVPVLAQMEKTRRES